MTLRDVDIETSGRLTAHESVRLGVIDYLNVVPVYDWLLRNESNDGLLSGVQTVAGVPAQMNRAMAAGEVDISNVSSFAYGEHTRDWLLAPHLSVAADGRVDSVLLFSWRKDWRALDGGSVALTDHSATSIALTRLLCERRYGARPLYVTCPPDLERMLAEHDAALLIGDIALVEGYSRREIAGRGQPYVFDLAAEWKAWTNLPFVFAVWAVRTARAEAVRESGALELLRTSKEHGLLTLDALADSAARRLGLPHTVCAEYLRLLDYELTERDLVGLRTFLEMVTPDFTWSDVHFA
ncbi:MAG: chorismate dehydratase [Ktedonobacterales bacterium]|jgi:chorismate dehydratase|nr:MAG: chorismate dehydratase [Ktedonobacterales bacterium]